MRTLLLFDIAEEEECSVAYKKILSTKFLNVLDKRVFKLRTETNILNGFDFMEQRYGLSFVVICETLKTVFIGFIYRGRFIKNKQFQ